MKFSDVVTNAAIDCMAGIVPCIIGHAGVGKSQLPKAIRKFWIEKNNEKASGDEKLEEDDIDIVILFGSLIKEGELGGIPVTDIVKDEETGKRKAINTYTTHVKMERILENHRNGKMTLLFIDEINRCEPAVQQELMQLILDKQINETYLPNSCAIICAGNPEVDDYCDYQVTIMNDALKNRFVQYFMDSNTEEWIKWALQPDEDDPEMTNVDEDVIEFIAEYPNMLHVPNSAETIKPTPRGVTMFSDAYRFAKYYFSGEELEDIVLHQARGVCGTTWANQFVSFIRNKDNPLVKPEEIINSKDDDFDNRVLKKIKGEGPLRQFIIVDRLINRLDEMIDDKKLTSKNIDKIGNRFNDILESIPKDSMFGIIKDVYKNHNALYKLMITTKRFMDIFLEVNKQASQA